MANLTCYSHNKTFYAERKAIHTGLIVAAVSSLDECSTSSEPLSTATQRDDKTMSAVQRHIHNRNIIMKWHTKRNYIKRRSLTVINKTRIQRGADGVTCCRYQQRLLKLVYMRLLQQVTSTADSAISHTHHCHHPVSRDENGQMDVYC